MRVSKVMSKVEVNITLTVEETEALRLLIGEFTEEEAMEVIEEYNEDGRVENIEKAAQGVLGLFDKLDTLLGSIE